MNRLIRLMLGLTIAVGLTGLAIAGSVNSPGAPSAGSGMYTFSQIYDYLNAGTVPTIPGSFQGPSGGPGSTMYTTGQIIEAVATPFAQCDTTAEDVRQGKKFFSTVSGDWGVRTGTWVTPTPPPTPTPPDYLVQIGSLYAAKWTDNAGTDFNVNKDWSTAVSWAAGLDWLEKPVGSWRLPTKDELANICSNKGLLGTYSDDYTWSSTTIDANYVWVVLFSSCGLDDYPKTGHTSVRAVRSTP
ncbi:MAG: hypothetical protein NTZ78_09585 [Candidatus Aureabacteria bacterium]|nr:hypothetical protein [Candidatus Auribacterota bacterium]